MSRFAGLVILLVVAALGCDQSGGGAGSGSAGSGSAVAQVPAKNPGGGFSADLAKKLGGGATKADGSAAEPAAKTEAATTEAGKTEAATTEAGKTEAGKTEAGKTEAGKTEAGKTEAAKTEAAKTEVAKTEAAKTEAAKPAPPVSTAPKVGTDVVSKPKVVSAELKAININLLPNWERDVIAPGTISIVVKIPGKTETATFMVNYGIEDSRAPADRDAYKKWLADQKIFTSKDDRQKGVAWYLEGVDGAGKPAFRMVVMYGGKKLICYGSLYKESSLGELRDQTIIQAKQICETLTL